MNISKVFLLLTFSLLVFFLSTNICYTSDLEKYNNITIKGTIENYKSISKYIDRKSFLQLVFLPPNLKILGTTNVKGMEGRTQLVSDGQKTLIKKDGSFLLKCNKIKAGSYIIVVQLSNEMFGIIGNFQTNINFINDDLDPTEMIKPGKVRLLLKAVENDKLRATLVTINNKISNGATIDLGNLRVLFPE